MASGPLFLMKVYLEVGKKRVFAGAVDWPGWCRSGRDEATAIQALLDYGPRYARVLRGTSLDFQSPDSSAALDIVERLEGNATTDFGAPNVGLAADAFPVDEDRLVCWQILLRAAWQSLDEAVQAAAGRELRKGPRGGGRDLEAIVDHVLGAEGSYLSSVGWKLARVEGEIVAQHQARTRQAVLDGLVASARGELPRQGPRGGQKWAAGTFVRRVAWHVLDHAWEIEDRIVDD